MGENICPVSMVSGNPTGCHLGCKLLDPTTKKCLLLSLIEKKVKGDDEGDN